jgi:hypothetical protein
MKPAESLFRLTKYSTVIEPVRRQIDDIPVKVSKTLSVN